MAKVLFTEKEFTRLSGVFERLMAQRAQLPKSEWKKGTHKIVKSLHAKFFPTTMPVELHEVHLDRNGLRFLEGAMQQSLRVLGEQVLPEYRSRNNDEYVKKTEDVIATYTSILKKVEAAL